MRDLIATKSFTYATRALKAGEPFTARNTQDARILVALKKAERAPDPDVTALRAEYQDLVGKKPYMGWDAATLADKIEEAKNGTSEA